MTAVDPDTLAEALEQIVEMPHVGVGFFVEPPVVDAARAFLEAPTADWCFEHDTRAGTEGCAIGAGKGSGIKPCRVGRVRLVAEDA